jgi:hypothetical protein
MMILVWASNWNPMDAAMVLKYPAVFPQTRRALLDIHHQHQSSFVDYGENESSSLSSLVNDLIDLVG